MKNNLLFVLLLLFYNFLFWEQGLGINLVLFASVLVGLALFQRGKATVRLSEILIICSFLVSAFAVLVFNSVISITVLLICTISYLGYLSQERTSVIEAFVNSFLSLFRFDHPVLPAKLWPEQKRKPAGVLYLRVAIIPLLIFILYFAIFTAGNSIFQRFSNSFFGRFFDFLADLSYTYLVFLLLGVLVVRWAFMRTQKQRLQLEESSDLSRKSKRAARFVKRMGLRHEYLAAIMIFGSLNLLFLAINYIDVRWVWFQFYLPDNFDLKEFVHEGVGWLIISLLLSMGMIFYFFRYNLNFYPKSTLLKALAQLWIFQNAVLAVSVALRTYYYIDFHGLASKRIGVLVFLLLVIFGLASLSYKIFLKKNTPFVLRANSVFALVVFSLCTLVPWDSHIARHNLQHQVPNEVDVDNYLQLNPQALPIIYENLQTVEDQINAHNKNEIRWISFSDIETFKSKLDLQARNYLERREAYDMPSWTWADQQAYTQLRAMLNDKETASAF